MDQAVALVEAYLRVNGYFTVTEFPVLEMVRGECRTVTDLDILAFRFAGAGTLVPPSGQSAFKESAYAPDPELGCPPDCPDMLIGEVKEGRAELNQGATNPAVLRTALTRFGCCHARHVPAVVHELLREGHAQTHCGHRIRLAAFGSTPGCANGVKCQFVSLRHVEQFLREYIRDNWKVIHHAQFKDPALAFLVLLEKADHGLLRPSLIPQTDHSSMQSERESKKGEPMKTYKVVTSLFVLALLFVISVKAFPRHSPRSYLLAAQSASKQEPANKPMAMDSEQMMAHHKEMAELVDQLRASIDAIETEKDPATLKGKLSEHRRMIERLQAGMKKCFDEMQQMAKHMKTCPMMKSQHKHQ